MSRIVNLVEGTLAFFADLWKSTSVPGPDDDPTHWRRAIRASMILIGLVAIGLALWSAGALQYVGISPPILADEVDRKITKRLEPLEEKINETAGKVDRTNHIAVAILRGLYDERVRQKVRQRCETEDAEKREDLNQQLERIKREFERLSGQAYGAEPRCDQV